MKKKSIISVVVFATFVVAGYFANRETSSETSTVIRPATQPGWILEEDPAGFALERPESWSLQSDKASGRVLVRGQQGEEIVIWPLFVPGGLDAQSAAALLQRFSATLRPAAQWAAAQSIAPTTIRLTGTDGKNQVVAALAWVPSPSGAAAVVYQIAATPAQLAANGESLRHVLESFRLVGRELAADERSEPSEPRWVTFREPNEGAWTVEMPEGWTARGGLSRVAPVDVRHGFAAQSADGGALIFQGDVRIPAYVPPTQITRMQGYVEGSPYSPGYGVREEIRTYMPGQVFAEFYVRNYLAESCGQVTITESRDRPEIAQVLNAMHRQRGLPTVSTTGQVNFSCQSPQGAMFEGWCFARTDLVGPALWTAPIFWGYLAVPAQLPLARQAAAHMMSTLLPNPEWVRMQQGVTAHASRATAEVSQATADIIAEVSGRRDASMDELARRRSNATLGVEDVTDPLTGRQFKVESGGNYYWVDAAGNIAGTRTAGAPSIDFRELLRAR